MLDVRFGVIMRAAYLDDVVFYVGSEYRRTLDFSVHNAVPGLVAVLRGSALQSVYKFIEEE